MSNRDWIQTNIRSDELSLSKLPDVHSQQVIYYFSSSFESWIWTRIEVQKLGLDHLLIVNSNLDLIRDLLAWYSDSDCARLFYFKNLILSFSAGDDTFTRNRQLQVSLTEKKPTSLEDIKAATWVPFSFLPPTASDPPTAVHQQGIISKTGSQNSM